MIKRLLGLIVIGFCLVSSFQPSSARAGYFGLITGLTFPSNASATFGFGATFNWDFFGSLGLAFTYISYGSSSVVTADGDTVSTDLSSKNFLVEANWALSGSLENFIVGAKIGLLFVSQTASVTTSSTSLNLNPSLSKLVFGPKIAYDYKFGSFSIGAEISYILGLGSDAPNTLMILPTTKFWF